MTFLTVQVDEAAVAKASEAASQRQLSLDAVLNEALLRVAMPLDPRIEKAVEQLRLQKIEYSGQGMLTREERNHRDTKFDRDRETVEVDRDHRNSFLKAVREAGLFYTDGPFTRDELNER